MIHIPGFTFPVEEFLLEDVVQMTRWAKMLEETNGTLNCKHSFYTGINRMFGLRLGIFLRRRRDGPCGKKAFGRGVISGLRRRRKRQNTWKAGPVMHAPWKTGSVRQWQDWSLNMQQKICKRSHDNVLQILWRHHPSSGDVGQQWEDRLATDCVAHPPCCA